MRSLNIYVLLFAFVWLSTETNSSVATTINFDSLPANATGGLVEEYLAAFHVFVEGPTPGPGYLTVSDDRTMVFPPPNTPIVKASSGHNFLGATSSSNRQTSYRLVFDPPLTALSFTRIQLSENDAGTAYPGWVATAYDGANSIASVGPGNQTFSLFPPTVLPAETYSFVGQRITALQVDSFQNGFAAFGTVFLDDFVLTPVPEPACATSALLGVVTLLGTRRRR